MKDYLWWAYLSIFSNVAYLLILKKINMEGYDPIFIMVSLHLIMITFLIFQYQQKHNLIQDLRKAITNQTFLGLILVGGFCSFLNHYYGYSAYLSFSNPGYYQALITLEIVFLTILSVFLFGSSLGNDQIIGIGMVIAGSVIITWKE